MHACGWLLKRGRHVNPSGSKDGKFSSNPIVDIQVRQCCCCFQLGSRILELPGHLLIAKEEKEKGTVANFTASIVHAWSFLWRK